MSKRNVLIFTDSFNIGGSERQAVELIKRLDRSRFSPIVACFKKVGPLAAELPGGLEDVHAFPLSGFVSWGALRRAHEFVKLVRRMQVQVVQCFDFYSNLFAIPLARLAGVPVILGCRRDEAVMRSAAQQKAERLSYRLATGVIANADAIKSQLIGRDGLHPEKVWVIHNGLDLKRFDGPSGPIAGVPLENGTITVAMVANLRPEKGHVVFLKAIQQVVTQIPRAQFLIVGDGPMREMIEMHIKELGIAGSVTMTGAVTNIPSLLRSVDIVVLASLKNEGLPNAVMEAMAAGKPVVATDVGGTRELVTEGVTGYLVPSGDVSMMANRIKDLALSPAAQKTMGEKARRKIETQFEVERIARRFEQLYDELSGRR